MKKLSLWLPVVLWCGLIFYLSSLPNLRITESDWDHILRKGAHLLEYAVLVWLVYRALAGSTRWPIRRILIVSFFFSVFYAATDEYHQRFVHGRVGTPVDVVIDGCGAALACVIRRRRAVS